MRGAFLMGVAVCCGAVCWSNFFDMPHSYKGMSEKYGTHWNCLLSVFVQSSLFMTVVFFAVWSYLDASGVVVMRWNRQQEEA